MLRTGSDILDAFLNGGIPCNSITELVGESACGKTQLCLQIALNAQLPPARGGLSAATIFIYTEYNFPFKRLQQLSQYIQTCHPNIIPANPSDFIYVHLVEDAHQLLHLMTHIESFICSSTSQMPVRLIVIDSIAALFRSQFENNYIGMSKRATLFYKLSEKLKKLSNKFGLAVVVTNQVGDCVGSGSPHIGNSEANMTTMVTFNRHVYPALGLTWSKCVNIRIFMSRNEEIVEGGHLHCGLTVTKDYL